MKDLAQQLAAVAKRIEKVVPQVYRQERKDGYLHKLLASFQQELLPFLKLEAETDKEYGFADIYAQTVAYSLFTAKVFSHISWQKDLKLDSTVKQPLFDRESAWQQLPETNPFLQKLFEDISNHSRFAHFWCSVLLYCLLDRLFKHFIKEILIYKSLLL